MKKLLLLILISFTISLQSQTLKEKFIETKSHYVELADKSGFVFSGTEGWADRFKKIPRWYSMLNIENSGKDANKYIAQVINDNSDILVIKVKQLAQKELNDYKLKYEASIDQFKAAAESDEILPDSTAILLRGYQELRKSLKPLNALTSVEVQSTWEGLIIMRGFSEYNRLLVKALNSNVELLTVKYKQAINVEFQAKKVALRQEANELVTEIDR